MSFVIAITSHGLHPGKFGIVLREDRDCGNPSGPAASVGAVGEGIGAPSFELFVAVVAIDYPD